MRVAALYDIHGNLPALEAVLDDVRQANVDQVVVGGDAVLGPMPRETLRRLLDLDLPVHFVAGNCELAILARMAAVNEEDVTYWGTVSGAAPPEPIREIFRWSAQQLNAEIEKLLAAWPKTLQLKIEGLGEVLFCHSTPRSETEVFTRLTAVGRLAPIFGNLDVETVVCGHTHMQFDRMIGDTRVVNAGSVGQPYGTPGAYWLLLGPDIQLRHTVYDFSKAAERVRRTTYPQAEEFAQAIQSPTSEAEMLEVFAKWAPGD